MLPAWLNQKYTAPESPEYARLRDLGVQIVEWSYDMGWDKQHGGLFYFLDSVCQRDAATVRVLSVM